MSAQSRIIDAAARLAHERGDLEGVTVDQIASGAGVAKATLYRHFGSKAAIAAELGLALDAEDRRTRILDATVRFIGELGLANTTVERVAAAAGISPATVYWHFGSKEELVVEAIRHIAPVDLGKQMAESLDGPPEEALRRLLATVASIFQQGSDLLPVLMVEVTRNPRLADVVFERITGPIWGSVARYMQDQTQRGRFRAGDPMHRVFCLAGPLIAMAMVRRTFGERVPVDPERAVDDIVSTFLRGVSQ
jgi:AcrR family transcriptional regulator